MSECSSSSIRHNTQSIAIVGMAAEFPGAEDPECLWNVLNEGINTLEQVSGRL